MPVLSAVPVGTNFYPRPPRGGRRIKQDGSWSSHSISIHALREEGDLLDLIGVQGHEKFLSTPSARRATQTTSKWSKSEGISIHALREEGD